MTAALSTSLPPAYRPPSSFNPDFAGPIQTLGPVSSDVLLIDNSYEGRLARRDQFIKAHEISSRYQGYLEKLCSYHLVIVPDDSGSMNTRAQLNQPSEWENLGRIARIVAEVGTIYDEQGIDVCFLNRGEVNGVHDPNALCPSFAAAADGYTPLPARLEELFERHKKSEKDVVFIIPTDGHPTATDVRGNEDQELGKAKLIEIMDKREKDKALCKKLSLSFVMCTGEQDVVDYYDSFTKKYTNVTITENYAAEKREMTEKRPKLPYTEGDWIVKIVLGAVIPEIGAMDQFDDGCCCLIQ